MTPTEYAALDKRGHVFSIAETLRVVRAFAARNPSACCVSTEIGPTGELRAIPSPRCRHVAGLARQLRARERGYRIADLEQRLAENARRLSA